ncbi:RraA family protein [Candidatus Poribacteria bacterium]|jgi:regulator of RNase E activity RraA|nr:RraA family protein [Candidatus Poribacteria bacterium]MBT5535251.1 RraA family protein [Candidatus Poribacteria bacterium]MBT5711037.1 RraA family protein [Candidatus Poribacteria bacterium]MBT7098328.1 RraA family protein [Candidatus Poribacteria bacterium]MBT7804375.1 RraA family protein [Candidatus Poribacteria bacterium]
MAHESDVGFRVVREIERPSRDVLALFDGVESTQVSDAMHRFLGMDGDIKPVGEGMRVVGPAVTVRARAGDNLMVYAALDVAEPGDVIVIETRRHLVTAVWGDLVSMAARELGIGGMVTDGVIRDRAGVIDVGVPVFATGDDAPQGAYKDGPGEVNTPIACGGVPVLPGDVIVADANGVVVVPRADAEAVARSAQAILANEETRVASITGGTPVAESVREALREKGCRLG